MPACLYFQKHMYFADAHRGIDRSSLSNCPHTDFTDALLDAVTLEKQLLRPLLLHKYSCFDTNMSFCSLCLSCALLTLGHDHQTNTTTEIVTTDVMPETGERKAGREHIPPSVLLAAQSPDCVNLTQNCTPHFFAHLGRTAAWCKSTARAFLCAVHDTRFLRLEQR